MFPLKIKLKTEKARKRGAVPEGSVELAGSWLGAGHLPGAPLQGAKSPWSPAWVWAASLGLATLPGGPPVGWGGGQSAGSGPPGSCRAQWHCVTRASAAVVAGDVGTAGLPVEGGAALCLLLSFVFSAGEWQGHTANRALLCTT